MSHICIELDKDVTSARDHYHAQRHQCPRARNRERGRGLRPTARATCLHRRLPLQ
nr:MAG: hypothetical protein [Molluscum contagiosum virus]